MRTFQIIDGVRRAKAFAMEGKARILADVLDENSRLLGTQEIALDALRSPKSVIDISNPRGRHRFDRLRQALQDGIKLPPIAVWEGSRGVPISQIEFVESGGQDG